MDLAVPCNSCNWAATHRRPAFYRNTTPLRSTAYPFNASKCSLKTTSELQSTVGVTGSAGSTLSPAIPTHKVTVHDRQRGVVHEFLVPEDQYILHTAESQNISLPYACRHVERTRGLLSLSLSFNSCFSKIEGLRISCGYALLCVGFPSSDLEVETQDEDEDRDDYALELAMGDE
ncbi:hypothetical protein TIFTF001_002902 [Ficus carica]|uniref:2Fe-2S ferredoxin-type domain-containing protein n=1 Tax=Ficus carica TaxID=3494 RepID=A0AA88CUU9_FICCA|nr:hypothetical protein TIFTF001_002902 [Ficus carica]